MSSNESSTDTFRVGIIGAGTGGLCLAHGLRKAGVNVTVYERDRNRIEGPHGFWIGIDPDGSRALHSCLPGDLYDTFVATCALPIQHFSMLTEKGKEVLTLDVPPGDDRVNSEKSVNRSTLRQVMLTGLDDVVQFDRTFTKFSQTSEGRVQLEFADGSVDECDLLVGADGTSSRVRQQLAPDARLVDTGLWGVTGKIPLDEETRSLMTQRVIDGVSIFSAPGGDACVFHVVDLPWDRGGRPKARVSGRDQELLARWSGLQYDPTRDYIMFGFAGAAARLPQDMLTWNGKQLHDLVRQRTARWSPQLRRLFERADPESCFPLNIRTSQQPSPWASTNVTLLGDAIHTMTPGRGVGANTALRDADLLCRLITECHEGKTSLARATTRYQTEMFEYAFHAVERSRSRMNAGDPVYRPYAGRLVLAARRTGMRTVNQMPAIKRRMAKKEQEFRGAHRST